MINHPIGRFHISLHNFFAVDRDEGRVVRQLGVDVQPQVGQHVQVVEYMFDMCKTSKMFTLRDVQPQGAASRGICQHVVGEVRAEDSSRNHMRQENLVEETKTLTAWVFKRNSTNAHLLQKLRVRHQGLDNVKRNLMKGLQLIRQSNKLKTIY